MRAVSFAEFAGPLSVVDVPDPVAGAGAVVLRVDAAGLCRSDWHGWQGHDDDITTLPHIPGHEVTGTIVEVGNGVQRWREGERVIVPFVCGCGTCATCETGNYQVCPHQWQPGFHGPGAFAEYVEIPYAEANLVRLPTSIPTSAAASLGCRTATAYRALALIARLQPGEEFVVYGAGGVGLSAVMIARAIGARTTVVDPDPAARDLAHRFGAAASFGVDDDTVEAVLDATGGGAHVSLDAIGTPEVPLMSIMGLRRRGRHVQVGLLPHGAQVPMGAVISRELAVLGSHGLAGPDYPELLELITRGALHPDALLTRTISLDEVPAALPAMGSSEHPAGVTLINPYR